MAAATTPKALFEPLKVGAWTLPNRLVMAPLTRCRAEMPGHVAGKLIAEHYAQRASAGLLIAEATMILDKTSAFATEPGIFNQACIDGWKLTTEAVHKAGGRILLQIWHGGRQAHPVNNEGEQSVSATDKAMTHGIEAHYNLKREKIPHEAPRALRDDEIPAIIEAFRQAARNAIEAGFDGVQIHGANGYLLDQFLRAPADARSGPYGGPLENRARLLLEVTEAVAKEIGADRTSVRISPLNSFGELADPDPAGLTAYVAAKLSDIGIAFLDLLRSDFYGVQKGDVVTPARENFKGVLMLGMGYDIAEAEAAIASKQADAIIFGTKFLANPDLVERARIGAELNALDFGTFYTPGPAGYTDYPTLEQARAAKVAA